MLLFISYSALSVMGALCLLPFLMVLSGSFSSEHSIIRSGYSIFPQEFTLKAYRTIFLFPMVIVRGYLVTSSVTVIGTTLGLLVTSMTAYVLARREFVWRNAFSFFFYFTTLFSGGIVPWYILCTRYLKFSNNYLALFVPYLLNVFYIIIMKSFIKGLPESILEAAKIDGASPFAIYRRIVLPLSLPAIASIGLFIALVYWNDWFLAWVFMTNGRLYTLQFNLYSIITGAEALRQMSNTTAAALEIPREPLKLATTIITLGPIVLAYPFVQRYFVTGLTIGAVKG